MATRREYGDHWEKPEWIYDQVLKVEKRAEAPDMVALKQKSGALYQQRMAQEFPEFFQRYTKIFFRCINGQLNKQLLLMLLKQRQKMDNGEVSWTDGNSEVIGASFNLMLRGLDPELRDKVANTYTDLVKEDREATAAAIREKLAEAGDTTAAATEEELLKVVDELARPLPMRVEEVVEEIVEEAME